MNSIFVKIQEICTINWQKKRPISKPYIGQAVSVLPSKSQLTSRPGQMAVHKPRKVGNSGLNVDLSTITRGIRPQNPQRKQKRKRQTTRTEQRTRKKNREKKEGNKSRCASGALRCSYRKRIKFVMKLLLIYHTCCIISFSNQSTHRVL